MKGSFDLQWGQDPQVENCLCRGYKINREVPLKEKGRQTYKQTERPKHSEKGRLSTKVTVDVQREVTFWVALADSRILAGEGPGRLRWQVSEG